MKVITLIVGILSGINLISLGQAAGEDPLVVSNSHFESVTKMF